MKIITHTLHQIYANTGGDANDAVTGTTNKANTRIKSSKNLQMKTHMRNAQTARIQEKIGYLSHRCNNKNTNTMTDFTTELCDTYWRYLTNFEHLLQKHEDLMTNTRIEIRENEDFEHWDVI